MRGYIMYHVLQFMSRRILMIKTLIIAGLLGVSLMASKCEVNTGGSGTNSSASYVQLQ